MKIKKFIAEALDKIGVKIDSDLSKKKALKELIKKLENKEDKHQKSLEKKPIKSKKKEIKNELSIIEVQKRKAKKLLNKLD